MIKHKYLLLKLLTLCSLFLTLVYSYENIYAAENYNQSHLMNLIQTFEGDNVNGNTLPYDADFTLKYSFGIPIESNKNNNIAMHNGDTITWTIPDTFIVSNFNSNLIADGTPIGTLDCTSNTITITLNENIDTEDLLEVTAGFTLNLKLDKTKLFNIPGSYTINFNGTDYTYIVPEKQLNITASKAGTLDLENRKILWTITYESKNVDGQTLPLDGYLFTDNLLNVGEYINGSFKVKNLNNSDYVAATPTYDAHKLSYTIPVEGDATFNTVYSIQYETLIPDELYFSNEVDQTITNTAKLTRDQQADVDCTGKVSFKQNWIDKSGNVIYSNNDQYNPKDRKISWLVEFNQPEYAFVTAEFIDELPAALVINLDDIKVSQYVTNDYQDITTTLKSNSRISLESNGTVKKVTIQLNQADLTNTNTKFKVEYSTAVADDNYTSSVKNFTNKAAFTIKDVDTHNYKFEDKITIGVGTNTITKQKLSNLSNDHKINWEVNVNFGAQTNFAKGLNVKELLVYGDSVNLDEIATALSVSVDSLPAPSYNMKYAGNFVGPSLKCEVQPITINGTVVADLLTITLANDQNLVANTNYVYTYDTQVTNLTKIMTNTESDFINHATLYGYDDSNNGTKIHTAMSSYKYKSNMLDKNILQANTLNNIGTTLNGATILSSIGKQPYFDYTTQRVYYVLSVNTNNVITANDLGTATISDTLDGRFKFVDVIDKSGSKFLLYDENKAIISNPQAYVSAQISDNTASFTFNQLDTTYYIVMSATYKDENTLISALAANSANNIKNSAAINFENGTNDAYKSSDEFSFNTAYNVLEKNYTKSGAGEITWKIEYVPYGTTLDSNVVLEDKLPEGVDLPIKADGTLDTSGFLVKTLNVDIDGKTSSGSSVSSDNIFTYNATTRELSITVPTPTNNYEFSYKTIVTAETAINVANNVSLNTSKLKKDNVESSYAITSNDVTASLKKGGYLKLKLTGESTPLPNTQYTLLDSTGTKVIRVATTDAAGFLSFKALPTGTYILRETYSNDAYEKNPSSYTIIVNAADINNIIVTIDGNTVNGNTLEINKKLSTNNGNNSSGGNNNNSNNSNNSNQPPINDKVEEDPQPSDEIIEVQTPPKYTYANLPNPTHPDSPDEFILIDEAGLPLGTYTKVNENGKNYYKDAFGKYLGDYSVPNTDDLNINLNIAIILGILTLLWGFITLLQKKYEKVS